MNQFPEIFVLNTLAIEFCGFFSLFFPPSNSADICREGEKGVSASDSIPGTGNIFGQLNAICIYCIDIVERHTAHF